MDNNNPDIENQNVRYYQNNNVTFLQQVNNFLQEHPIINMAVSAMVGGIITEALKHSGEIIENFFDLEG